MAVVITYYLNFARVGGFHMQDSGINPPKRFRSYHWARGLKNFKPGIELKCSSKVKSVTL
jgi:hypothetical protein